MPEHAMVPVPALATALTEATTEAWPPAPVSAELPPTPWSMMTLPPHPRRRKRKGAVRSESGRGRYSMVGEPSKRRPGRKGGHERGGHGDGRRQGEERRTREANEEGRERRAVAVRAREAVGC